MKLTLVCECEHPNERTPPLDDRYIIANIIVFVHASAIWFKKASDAELTAWVGLAKVAGKMLDFNLALLLIPVTRSLMLWMNDFGEHSSFGFAKWIPLRHNIEFHKVCALVVLGCASVHVIAHYIDFVFVPRKILNLYSYGPWITGPMICVSMFHIYSSAPEIVRRSKYLIFWYNHHAFIFFYLLLFVHMVQKETYFEQFFPYAIVPVLMYVCALLFILLYCDTRHSHNHRATQVHGRKDHESDERNTTGHDQESQVHSTGA